MPLYAAACRQIRTFEQKHQKGITSVYLIFKLLFSLFLLIGIVLSYITAFICGIRCKNNIVGMPASMISGRDAVIWALVTPESLRN